MDNKGSWWMKGSKSDSNIIKAARDRHLSEGGGFTNPLTELFEKDNDMSYLDEIDTDEEVDIPSILDEITRLSAKSPLVPYEKDVGDRSIEDIMREAERIYLESSKSFEQLSQRSKTSHNISEIASMSEKSNNSTPTPKSLSPLPLDEKPPGEGNTNGDEDSSEEDDITEKSTPQEKINLDFNLNDVNEIIDTINTGRFESENANFPRKLRESYIGENERLSGDGLKGSNNDVTRSSCEFDCVIEVIDAQIHKESKRDELNNEVASTFKEEIVKKDEVIKMLIVDNRGLKEEIKSLEVQIEEMKSLLEQATASMRAQSLKSPEINLELENALEELKDTKELNTALQLQLDNTNKSHQMLRVSYEELLDSNKQLERRMLDVDGVLAKYKAELQSAQQQKDKLAEHEASVVRLLELEKTQVKNLKQQLEKDSKCILDLNRQIKEMERIIARKHPDSVSALIVAAKSDAENFSSPTTRRVLEDRIKILEQEALMRDAQNSQVFIDVHEKFNQMKLKYENHIEDLELHVSDLKSQLKKKVDTYDVYTQTVREEAKMIPEKDTSNIGVQTEPQQRPISKTGVVRKPEREREAKEETHLLATIRGFQADLSNKEKVIAKLQKEIDELRKTNRRLQKEREGSLKNLSDKKEFRSYPEKLAQSGGASGGLDEELRAVKTERDKMKFQLCRIEEDYQSLKEKRLHDLNALQEAHERELATYLANVTPLREQLEVQQVSLSALQQQLLSAKEQLAVVTVERDHLNNKLNSAAPVANVPENFNGNDGDEVLSLRKKISHLELKYEERENRLRAIVHGLAQKSVTNRSCEQCSARQQQLIGYKAELDQIIATLRCLQ